MRGQGRLGKGALFLVVISLIPSGAVLAEDPDKTGASDDNGGNHSSKSGRWFGSDSKEKEKKPSSKNKQAEKILPLESSPLAAPDHALAERRSRVQDAFLRHLAVCDQLREIALKKNDTTLEQQADKLNQKAFEVYTRCMADLRPGATPADLDLKGKRKGQGEHEAGPDQVVDKNAHGPAEVKGENP